MRKRLRIRRLLKWTALVSSLLIATVSAASCLKGIGYVHSSFDVRITGGVASFDSPSVLASSGYSSGFDVFDFMVINTSSSDSLPRFCRLPAAYPGGVEVPLGIPLVMAVTLTAAAFWRDRRHIPPGHCRKCGYDLTGNKSGICPECGTPIPKDTQEPEPTTDSPQQ